MLGKGVKLLEILIGGEENNRIYFERATVDDETVVWTIDLYDSYGPDETTHSRYHPAL